MNRPNLFDPCPESVQDGIETLAAERDLDLWTCWVRSTENLSTSCVCFWDFGLLAGCARESDRPLPFFSHGWAGRVLLRSGQSPETSPVGTSQPKSPELARTDGPLRTCVYRSFQSTERSSKSVWHNLPVPRPIGRKLMCSWTLPNTTLSQNRMIILHYYVSSKGGPCSK